MKATVIIVFTFQLIRIINKFLIKRFQITQEILMEFYELYENQFWIYQNLKNSSDLLSTCMRIGMLVKASEKHNWVICRWFLTDLKYWRGEFENTV